MDQSQDFKSMQEKIQGALVAATRTSNQIAAEDLDFQRNTNPAVDEQLDETTGRLLALSTSLLKSATKGTDVRAPKLEDADDVDVHWSRVVDVIDNLLEKADTCLDEYTGLVKRKAAPTEEVTAHPKKTKTYDSLDPSLRRANILKPQQAFELKPDNLDTSPWRPLLTEKPHAIIPLTESLGTINNEENTVQYDYTIFLPHTFKYMGRCQATSASSSVPSETSTEDEAKRKRRLLTRHQNKTRRLWRDYTSVFNADGTFRYKHPYETEILQMNYPDFVYEIRDSIKYQPVETTTATFVDTFEGVLDMLEELKKAKEIAIDTEHHDFRTYNGLLSLMQISTRDKDWIVDTLQPWRHKLAILNEVFADPKILKVLHGAYMDVIWLQRDCGIYLVGLFDTFHAADTLSYPARSLAYLLKRFVDFDADKKYQLADWRIRPLPDEMFYYARSDTHYLLYVYDELRNELLRQSDRSDPEKRFIDHVLEKSKEVSLRRYEKYVYDVEGGEGPVGFYNLIMKSSGTLSKEQFAVFRAVHKWRDDMARREDESPLFIMNNSILFDIARRLPPDPKALHGLLDHASYVAKKSVEDLFKVVDKARIAGADGPSVTEFLRGGNIGVGEVAQKVFPQLKEKDEGVPDVEDLILKKSQLFGDMPISSRWDPKCQKPAASEERRFALPWASFVQNASFVDASAVDPAPSKPEIKAAMPTRPAPDAEYADEEFTLKAGVKRKASSPDSDEESEEEGELSTHQSEPQTPALEGDSILLGPGSDDEQAVQARQKAKKAEKKARRQQKRLEKKAKKDAKAAAKATAEADAEEEPFDYTKAQSVLNVQRSATNNSGANGGAKGKVFNPYSSLSADGPKPARKMHGEKPGRTHTFKAT